MEAEAIITILKHIESSEWRLVNSGIVNYEINQTSNEERKGRLQSLVRWASEFVSVDQDTYIRAKQIQEFGIKTYDALHIACAEQGKVDVFLSTDDKLIKIAKRNSKKIKIDIENPLVWLHKEVV